MNKPKSSSGKGFGARSCDSKNKAEGFIPSDKAPMAQAIKAYKEGRLLEARRHLTSALNKDNPDAYMLGILATIEKAIGNTSKAAELYEASIRMSREHADVLHNYSSLLVENDARKALSLSERAVELSPVNAFFWERLGYIRWKCGDPGGALDASKKAIQLDRSLAGARLNIASILIEQGRLEEALTATLEVARIKPDHVDAHVNVGGILLEQGHLDEALAATLKALQMKADNYGAYVNLGGILKEQGMLEPALAATLKALELNPNGSKALLRLGSLRLALGEMEEGSTRLWQAIDINPQEYGAYFELSLTIRTRRDATELLGLVDTIEINKMTPREKSLIHFTKSNCLHRLKEYGDSAQQLIKANTNKLIVAPSNAQTLIEAINRSHKQELDHTHIQSDHGKGRVFIVGMPRCGSSLLETVLSCNPLIQDLGETKALSLAIEEGRRQSLGEQSAKSLDFLYSQHLANSPLDYAYSVDKQLYNFMHVGIIAKHMPSAKIIHCHRNAMDNILSMFRGNLTTGNNFTSSMEDAANVLVAHERLMRIFKSEHSDRIYTFSYDSFVKEPKRSLQPLLAWLQLEWKDEYLYPERSQRTINTASVIQARRPINSNSVSGWLNYRTLLKPAERIIKESKLFEI